MTAYFLVHDDEHNFLEGFVEILNSAAPTHLSRVSKAYFELSVPTSPIATLDRPSLIGFLYQMYEGKRSRPYPIVSQQQSINLDFRDCDAFLFVVTNRLIDDYTLKLYVADDSSESGSVDLSDYATTSALSAAIDGLISGSQLTTTLSDYALLADIPTASAGLAHEVLSDATILEVNKRYLVDDSGVGLILPTAPDIGDVVEIAVTNHTCIVEHGTSAQRVRNNNTLTSAGLDNGIALKPYSAIRLIYAENDLWVSSYRIRTINNYTPAVIDSNVIKQTYTATAPTPSNGTLVTGMSNGIKTTGSLSNGYLTETTTGDILLTFANPVIIDQIRLCNGQANNGAGINDPYSVRDITVYAGSTVSAENLGAYTFSNTSPTEEVKTVTPNTSPSSTFLLKVNSLTARKIGILELEFWGKTQTGGEILV